jgi:hypothetical protein
VRPGLILPALTGIILLAGCAQAGPPPPPPGAVPAGGSIGTAEIDGRAIFKGTVPPREEIDMSSDAACRARGGAGVTREDVVISPDGSLRNVFVHVVSGLGGRVFAPPGSPVVLDQRGCSYHPHVFGIQVDQVLEIVNSDPTLHNIHSVPRANRPFNVGMPLEGMRVRTFFTAAESMVKLKCDLHNWMIAWAGVTEDPFFDVTGETGRFAIKGLPAGNYVVEAWHEIFGTRSATIELAEGEKVEVRFDFSAASGTPSSPSP